MPFQTYFLHSPGVSMSSSSRSKLVLKLQKYKQVRVSEPSPITPCTKLCPSRLQKLVIKLWSPTQKHHETQKTQDTSSCKPWCSFGHFFPIQLSQCMYAFWCLFLGTSSRGWPQQKSPLALIHTHSSSLTVLLPSPKYSSSSSSHFIGTLLSYPTSLEIFCTWLQYPPC